MLAEIVPNFYQEALYVLHYYWEVEREQRTQLAKEKMDGVCVCARARAGKEQVDLHADVVQLKGVEKPLAQQ